jgi:hypothetical protein
MSETPVAAGDEVRVNTTVATSEFPSVAALAGGGFVVAWTYNNKHVLAQRFAEDGSPAGSEFQVSIAQTTIEPYPSVAGLADGGFVMTWESWDGIDDKAVMARRYAADGTPLTSEFLVNTETSFDQANPVVTALGDGGFVVVWSSLFQDGDETGIFAQRYDADGDAVGGEFQVNTYTTSYQTYPAVAALAYGGFVVTWQSFGQDGDVGVYGQRYAADGSLDDGEFQVNATTAGYQRFPSVVGLADGGFVVTWQHAFNDIYAQLYAADGSTVGGEFKVNDSVSMNSTYPSVTALPNGGFVVTWEGWYLDGHWWGMAGRRYAADGTALGDEFQINQQTLFEQHTDGLTGAVAVVALTDGRLVQVWEDAFESEINFRLFDIPDSPAAPAVALDRIVDSVEVDDASYTVSDLEAGATAVVAFSDGITDVTTAVLSADGSYTIDLSSLVDGPITTTVTVTASTGNVTVASGAPSLLNAGILLKLTLGQWNAFGAAQAAENDAFPAVIVLVNGKAAVQALSPVMIAALADQGVDAIDATGSELVLSADQYLALIVENVSMTGSDYVVLRDAAANLLDTLETEIGESGVDRLDATDNLLSLTIAEYQVLGDVSFTASDKVILADTSANLAALTASEIGAIASDLVDYIDATDDALTLDLAQYLALGATKLTAADTVTLADTAAAIEALTPADLGALAGKDIDILDATDGELSLTAQQLNALKTVQVMDGDALTVTGHPTAANTFDFGSQIFGDIDGVVGGSAADKLILGGSQSVAFGSDALGSINKLMLKDGGNYTLTMHDANVEAGKALVVTAMGGSLTFDGSAEGDGSFKFMGGDGATTFAGGGKGDTLLLGAGAETLRYTAASQSTGFGHDKVTGFDAAVDSFDIWTSVTVDSAITSGLLKGGAQFEATLTKAMADLEAGHAVLFTADAGNLAGVSFLVIDADGIQGWQSGADLVIRMNGLTGTITDANFGGT